MADLVFVCSCSHPAVWKFGYVEHISESINLIKSKSTKDILLVVVDTITSLLDRGNCVCAT